MYKGQIDNKNSAFVEVFGHSATIISINYERLFPINDHFIFTARIGVGRNPGADSESKEKYPGQTTVPIVGTFLAGLGSHYLQVSGSYTSIFSKDFVSVNTNYVYKKYDSVYEIGIGYRYMKVFEGNNIGINAQIYPTIEVLKKNSTIQDGVGFGMVFGVTF